MPDGGAGPIPADGVPHPGEGAAAADRIGDAAAAARLDNCPSRSPNLDSTAAAILAGRAAEVTRPAPHLPPPPATTGSGSGVTRMSPSDSRSARRGIKCAGRAAPAQGGGGETTGRA
jgi:hypothetical protein